jgi:hypothetical protein
MAEGVQVYRWNRIVVAVVAGCVLAGCTGQATGQNRADPAVEQQVRSWDGDDLLKAAGGMTRVGKTGVYFAVRGQQYWLAAVDVTTGQELWRHRVHQHGRIRGVVQTPTVDVEAGTVLTTAGEDADQTTLAALDLETGETLWEVWSPLTRGTPDLCGEESVCTVTVEGVHEARARSDGDVVWSAEPGLPVILGGEGDFVVTGDPDQRVIELARHTDTGYERVWRHSYLELFGDEERFSSDGGWKTWTDAETGATVVSIGPTLPPDDPYGTKIPVRLADPGGAVAFVRADGSVAASVTGNGTDSCYGLDWTAELISLCTVTSVEPGPDGEGYRVLLGSIEVRDITGTVRWSHALPAGADDTEVTHTSSEDVISVPGTEGSVLLDAATGTPVASSAGDDAPLVLCPVPVSDKDRFVTLEHRRHYIYDYLRLNDHQLGQPCRPDGTVVALSDLVADEGPHDWLGPASFAVSAPSDPADRWVITADPDGTLHGTGPAS